MKKTSVFFCLVHHYEWAEQDTAKVPQPMYFGTGWLSPARGGAWPAGFC